MTATQGLKRRLPNRLARYVIDLTIGAISEADLPPELRRKNPGAIALGHLKGGKTRAAALNKKRRREMARATTSVDGKTKKN